MPSYVYLRRVSSCYVIAALIPLCILGCDPKAEQNYKSLLEQIQSLQTNTENIKKYIDRASNEQVQIEKEKVRQEKILVQREQAACCLASSRAWKIEAEAFEKHNQANRERQRSIVNKQEARSVGTYEGYVPYSVSYLTTYTTLLPVARRDINNCSSEQSENINEIGENVEKAKKTLYNYPGYTDESLHKIIDDLKNKHNLMQL